MELFLDYPPPPHVAVSSVILCFLIILIIRHKRKKNLPPGNLGWPIIGETIDFSSSLMKGKLERFIGDRMSRHSSKVFKTCLMGEKMAVFCGPTGNKFIFSNEYKLMRVWLPYSTLKIFYGDEVVPSRAQEVSQRDRKIFSEFLRPYAIQNYVQMMDYAVKQHMDADWAPPNSNVKAYPLAKKLTFTLICRLFLGIDDPTPISRLEDQFGIVSQGVLSLPINFPGTTFRRSLKAANSMRDDIRNIIRTQSRSESASTPNFLSHLLSVTDREGKSLSESEIARMVMVALLAGHGTTSLLFTSLVYYLSHYPHVYALALTEQLEIKSLKGGDKLLTWEDIKKMKYCRNVINEVLRLSPSSVGAFRELAHDISYEGYTIPKGWKIFWSLNSTHNDPKYFPNPEKLDPTRFEGDGPIPYTHTPFGVGPRMCPGNEFSILAGLLFMHNLLINFKWENLATDEKIIPARPPASGMPIKLQRRGDDAVP